MILFDITLPYKYSFIGVDIYIMVLSLWCKPSICHTFILLFEFFVIIIHYDRAYFQGFGVINYGLELIAFVYPSVERMLSLGKEWCIISCNIILNFQWYMFRTGKSKLKISSDISIILSVICNKLVVFYDNWWAIGNDYTLSKCKLKVADLFTIFLSFHVFSRH